MPTLPFLGEDCHHHLTFQIRNQGSGRVRNIPKDAQLAYKPAVFLLELLLYLPLSIYPSITASFSAYALEPFPLPPSCLLSCLWAKALWMSVTGHNSRVEGWCFKCAFGSGCIDFSPLRSLSAKCYRQKSNRTASQSCSWGQAGHRSLHWHVGHISQMAGAQTESSKWWSETGDLLHRLLIADSLQQGKHGFALVSFRIIILALFFFKSSCSKCSKSFWENIE